MIKLLPVEADMTNQRLDEIKREIIKISESFLITKQNKRDNGAMTPYEVQHIQFLHFRLKELEKALEEMSIHDIHVPMIYKNMVNTLKSSMYVYLSRDYLTELKEYEKTNNVII